MDSAMVEKCVFSDCVQAGGILIAGDSNIHRIQRVTDEDCLAVSGARFTRDKKEFRSLLRMTVMKSDCSRIYLHLGSNDVLNCTEQELYKNITEVHVLDVVHEVRPEIEIVVCEILPRGHDRRVDRIRIPAKKVHAMGRWIRNANQVLKELSDHIQYTRFLSYGEFQVSFHLSVDGLHLNGKGAEWCYKKIARDNIDQQCLTREMATTTCIEGEDWPVVGKMHTIEPIHRDISYADAVQTSVVETESKITIKPEMRTKPTEPTISHQDKKTSRERARRRATKRRVEYARRRWFRRKFVRNNEMRSHQHPFDYTILTLSEDVAVEIPACQLSGPCLPKRCASLELDRTPTHRKERRTTPKEAKKQKWIRCPESGCEIVCSRDDFLIDHVIKRHVRDIIPKDSVRSIGLESPTTVPAKTKIESLVTNNTGKSGHYSDCTMKLDTGCVEYIFDDSFLKLMLANDVESNPGPVYQCGWENCTAIFEEYQTCLNHAIDHATGDKTCRWTMCSGYNFELLPGRLQHITRHIYDNDEWFQTLKDCGVEKIGEDLPRNTNLFNIPKHLRKDLKLLFFDEDFKLKDCMYTKEQHMEYLYREYTFNPTKFKDEKASFILKRSKFGEDWEFCYGPENYVNVTTLPANGSLSKEQNRNVCLPTSKNFKFVETTRSELATNYYSGTNLKSMSKKRKQEEILEHENETNNSSWFNVMLHNLKVCNQAIKYQKLILDKIFETVDSHNQKFLRIEQESAKLSLCTAGVFVCFLFKCKVNDKELYYIRYVDSGCFIGFMGYNHLEALKAVHQFSDENCILHNVITSEDIEHRKQANDDKSVKRNRSDKLIKRSFEEVLPTPLNQVKTLAESSGVEDLKLESYVVTVWPLPTKVNLHNPEKPFLEVSTVFCPEKFKDVLLEFRTNKPDVPIVNSKDIFQNRISRQLTMYKQSLFLNCLSDDTKRKPEMFKRPGKFESNFLNKPWQASSLRNYVLSSYLTNDLQNLASFLVRYFPHLNGDENLSIKTTSVDSCTTKRKKRKIDITKAHVNKDTLQKKLKDSVDCEIGKNEHVRLFDSFSFNMIHHGKLAIHAYDGSGLVCCMNDYSAVDGSFKESDFVYTKCLKQETGDHFICTCGTYSTLLQIDSNCYLDTDLVVLDSDNENCVTCMHCKFLKLKVIPQLENESFETSSELSRFVSQALKDKDKDIVQLCSKNETRKFSVYFEDDNPSLVHLTYSHSLGKHIISCMNGECLSKKGHKKTVENFRTAKTCKHLSVLHDHSAFWQDLDVTENSSSSVDLDTNIYTEYNIHPVNIDELPSNAEYYNVDMPLQNSETESNFNEDTGLWNFKCRSTHKPSLKNSTKLKNNVQKRDVWNDYNLKRDTNGCLIGPDLFPDMPENTCPCGSGWLKREDENNYNENGITINENNRILTVYTSNAPVKCKIFTRFCYNESSPCKIDWDEGCLDAIHVFSRDTAAGDEIGWEFVSLVMNSGCTFASYCKLKTDMYQIRDSRSKFMDVTIFLKWWFSWGASMKIDFRLPCDVCGFEPKRLCCDGTKVGVGFRHAKFDEIEKVASGDPIHQTLHRRMDRCFLKNKPEIAVSQMIKNREMLHYLAKETLLELKTSEILDVDTRETGMLSLMEVLPENVLPSFREFVQVPCRMSDNEKLAYSYLLKMLASTASMTSLLPPKYVPEIEQLLDPNISNIRFNKVMQEMRYYCPELRDFVAESIQSNGGLTEYMASFIGFLINESSSLQTYESESAVQQPGTYNPAKFGVAYYFNQLGLKLRNVRKFTMDTKKSKGNDFDDAALEFEKCQKLYSKVNVSARGTTSLFLWFCAEHGHCYGFHMTYAEGRKDPSASLYSYLEKPPTDIFYDFACNLQEYCLNRESGYYKDVRFFHDIFHGYAHKCSCSFRSSRLQGFECVNSEICEQFNAFIQSIKKSARQMTQEHFCFYLQFFLHEWNKRKRDVYQQKIKVALAGLD